MKRFSPGQVFFALVAFSIFLFALAIIFEVEDAFFYFFNLIYYVLLFLIVLIIAKQSIKRGWKVPGILTIVSFLVVTLGIPVFALFYFDISIASVNEGDEFAAYFDMIRAAIIFVQLGAMAIVFFFSSLLISILAPSPERPLTRMGLFFTRASLGFIILTGFMFIASILDMFETDVLLTISFISFLITTFLLSLVGCFRLGARNRSNKEIAIYYDDLDEDSSNSDELTKGSGLTDNLTGSLVGRGDNNQDKDQDKAQETAGQVEIEKPRFS